MHGRVDVRHPEKTLFSLSTKEQRITVREQQKKQKKQKKKPAGLLRELKELLRAHKLWLYGGELDILNKFRAQLHSGRALSAAQKRVVRKILGYVRSRRRPKIFRG